MCLSILMKEIELSYCLQIIFTSILFVTLLFEIIMTKSIKVFQIIILIISLGMLFMTICFNYYILNISTLLSVDVRFIFSFITLLFYILSFVHYFVTYKKNASNLSFESKYKGYDQKNFAPKVNLGDAKTFVILNKKGKLIKYTDDFYDLFKQFSKKPSKWYTAVEKCIFEGVEIPSKDLPKYFLKEKDDFNIIFYLINGKKISLMLSKKEQNVNKKQNNILLVNRKEHISEEITQDNFKGYKQKMYNYLCMLNNSVAFFDKDENVYVLNKYFMNEMNVSDACLSVLDFQSRIYKEDLQKFKQKVNNPYITSYEYRIKTNQGYIWAVENTLRLNSEDYNLIYLKEELANFITNGLSYKELIKALNALKEQTKSYYLIVISFKNVLEINSKTVTDNTSVLVNRYFKVVSSILKKDLLNVYAFGEIEYGVILDNYDEYMLLIRSLNNNNSKLLRCELYVNDNKYVLKNKIGIVESDNIASKNPEDMIKGALQALDIACDKNYENDYCIYYEPKQKKKSVNLQDYGIDTTQKFLDDLDGEERTN